MVKLLVLSKGFRDKGPNFRLDPKQIFVGKQFLIILELVIKKLFMEFSFINNLKNILIEVREINKTDSIFSSENLIPSNHSTNISHNFLWTEINVGMAFSPYLLDAKYYLG